MLDLVLWVTLQASPAMPAAPAHPTTPSVHTPTAAVGDKAGHAPELSAAQKEAAIREALDTANAASSHSPEAHAEHAHQAAPSSAPPGAEAKAVPQPTPVKPSASTTRSSLCSDLIRTAKDQAQTRTKIADERKLLEQERTRLEQLVKQIEDARASLREETQRLERLTSAAPGTAAPAAKSGHGSGYDKKHIDSLSKSLKSMKAEQAAGLLTRVDRPLAVELLRGMKPNDAGKILAQLKPDMAAELMADVASPALASGDRP